MKHLLTLFIFVVFVQVKAQTGIPYYQNFDSATVTNWTHYATSGTDDWVYGSPTKSTLDTTYAGVGSAVTKLVGNYTANSAMYLETPDFNLISVSPGIHIQFYYRYLAAITTTVNVQYSTNGGASWTILNAASSAKINWPLSSVSTFKRAAHNLDFLIGNLVRFRFYLGSGTATNQGLQIDEFEIGNDIYDLQATYQGTYTDICKYTTQVSVSNFVIKNYTYTTAPPYGSVAYYYSADNVLDAGDSLYLTGSYSTSTSIMLLPTFPHIGTWHIFYKLDNANVVAESDETNNVGHAVIVVDTMYTSAFFDFENDTIPWTMSTEPLLPGGDTLDNGWHIIGPSNYTDGWNYRGKSLFNKYSVMPAAGTYTQYVTSPFFDFGSDTGFSMICYWGRRQQITYSTVVLGAGINFSNLTYPPYFPTVPAGGLADDEWTCGCIDIDPAVTKFKKLRIFLRSDMDETNTNFTSYSIDDIYIGKSACDLTISEKRELFSPASEPNFTYNYTLWNAGIKGLAASHTEFYWSSDSILDAGDVLLGVNTEAPFITTSGSANVAVSFTFAKPTLIPGTYYVFSKVDADSTVVEYNENNNMSYFKLHQDPVFGLPYENDFETQIDGWYTVNSFNKNTWNWGYVPINPYPEAYTNTKLFYSFPVPGDSMGRIEIYTPLFDLTGTTKPVLEFDLSKMFGGAYLWSAPQANISYSIDNGYTWTMLDTSSTSFKGMYYSWKYNETDGEDHPSTGILTGYTLHYASEQSLNSASEYQSRDCRSNTRNVVEITPLNIYSKIQFRINVGYGTRLKNNPVLVDNFKLAEAQPEFKIIDKPVYYLKPTDTVLWFEQRVDNSGNYVSGTSQVDYYFSSDTLLDASDVPAISYSFPGISPKMNYYQNNRVPFPVTAPRNYLVYEIDKFNTVAETDETNNKGYFIIKDTSIFPPYYNDFSDDLHEGWSPYVYWSSYGFESSYRFRNHTALGEYLYDTGIKDNLFFTDRFYTYGSPGSYTNWPLFHLESPEFDFSSNSNIELTFNMMCVGTPLGTSQGATFEWSADGGSTWITVYDLIGDAYNWYDTGDDIDALDGRRGWYETPSWSMSNPIMDSIRINISFLSGQPRVKFRYVFRSHYMPYSLGEGSGLMLDDFKITANIATGKENGPKESKFEQLFYNNGTVFVEYIGEAKNYDYAIFDEQGKTICSGNLNLVQGINKATVPTAMATGLYCFFMYNREGEQNKLKFYYNGNR